MFTTKISTSRCRFASGGAGIALIELTFLDEPSTKAAKPGKQSVHERVCNQSSVDIQEGRQSLPSVSTFIEILRISEKHEASLSSTFKL